VGEKTVNLILPSITMLILASILNNFYLQLIAKLLGG